MWLLDNVMPCPDREYTIERMDLTGVNVMLDVEDATRDLKLVQRNPNPLGNHLHPTPLGTTCT